MVRQLSVFLENRPGRLANLVELMVSNGIGFKAMSIAEAGNYGIVRCVVDNEDKAIAVMKDANMAVNVYRRPSDGFSNINAVVKAFEEAGINIDYAYAADNGMIVLKVNDLQSALKTAKGAKLKVYSKI